MPYIEYSLQRGPQMTQVLIGTYRIDQARILDNPAQYKDELEEARNLSGSLQCLCNAQQLRLVVRSVKAGFILARWPLTGPDHDKQTCRFHAEDSRSGSRSPDSKKAFITTEEGLNIKLDVPLTVIDAPIAPRGDNGTGGGSGKPASTRQAAGLLAMLEFVWEHASLHKWLGQPQGRNWATCYSRLSGAVGEGMINGQPMSKVLHIMEPFDKAKSKETDDRLASFIEGLGKKNHADRRGLIIGEIRKLTVGNKVRVELKNSSLGNIFMSAELYRATVRSYRTALSSVGDPERKVIAILCIRLHDSGFADVISMAALMTSRAYIPCESSHELAMADRLVTERRRFTKPLRHLDNAPLHPDFELDDVAVRTVIEVWGMAGQDDYDERMSEKIVHYQQEGIECVGWEPVQSPVTAVSLPDAIH
jgi:hypothetical protein